LFIRNSALNLIIQIKIIRHSSRSINSIIFTRSIPCRVICIFPIVPGSIQSVCNFNIPTLISCSNYITTSCCLYSILGFSTYFSAFLYSKQFIVNSLIIHLIKHCSVFCIFISSSCLLFRH